MNQTYEDSIDLRRFPGRVPDRLDFGGFRRGPSPPLNPPIDQIYEDSIDLRRFPGRVPDRLEFGEFRRNPSPPLHPPLIKYTNIPLIYDDFQAERRPVFGGFRRNLPPLLEPPPLMKYARFPSIYYDFQAACRGPSGFRRIPTESVSPPPEPPH